MSGLSARTVPHDLEAEKAVLGAILINAEYLHDIGQLLSPVDFFRQAHRVVYEAMRGLSERRKPIDLLTLRDALGPKVLEDVGGPAYLASLMDYTPRSSNVEAHCAIVRAAATRRRLEAIAQQTIEAAHDTTVEADAAVERAEQAIYELGAKVDRGELRPAARVVDEAYAILEKLSDSKQGVTGVPTGFYDLDSTLRGLQPGNLVLLAARPAMGKTALALNIAHHAAITGGETVAFFSLEMSRTELMIRLITAAGRVDSHRLLSGQAHQGEHSRISGALAEVGAAPLWIDDTSSLTVTAIRGKSRRLKARQGLGLIVIDYLQLLSSERRYDSRVVEVGAMSRALKQLAKELEVPILCLSQLNRASENRSGGKPQLADLRESGSLEQDADVVLLLYRPEEYQATPDNAGMADLIVAKHRNGPTDLVKLRWSKAETRFDNLSPR